MAESPDYFADLLVPQEPILATVGGPGPTAKQGAGEERVWIQLAVTPFRMVAVKLVQGPATAQYRPALRQVVQRDAVRIRRFPPDERGPARLDIHGFGKDKLVLHIDDQTVFPQVEPFLVAWGGYIEGNDGVVPQPTADPGLLRANAPRSSGGLVYLALGGMVLGGVGGILAIVAVTARAFLSNP